MYYQYMLQLRDETNNFNNILWSTRLFQEYVCTMFYKIERQRLKYFRDHQKEVHAEKYHGIMDAIHNNDENLVSKNRVILPPSHYLSPRWYAKRLQDTIAICREYGRPHLFVTMTANAKWKGIYDSLHDGLETSPQRPDIVVRY